MAHLTETATAATAAQQPKKQLFRRPVDNSAVTVTTATAATAMKQANNSAQQHRNTVNSTHRNSATNLYRGGKTVSPSRARIPSHPLTLRPRSAFGYGAGRALATSRAGKPSIDLIDHAAEATPTAKLNCKTSSSAPFTVDIRMDRAETPASANMHHGPSYGLWASLNVPCASRLAIGHEYTPHNSLQDNETSRHRPVSGDQRERAFRRVSNLSLGMDRTVSGARHQASNRQRNLSCQRNVGIGLGPPFETEGGGEKFRGSPRSRRPISLRGGKIQAFLP